MLFLVASSNSVQSQPSSEYRIKAAFLLNFARFVEWPADAFATEKSPLTIGILGNDPFGRFLDDLVGGEIAHNRSIAVRRYQHVREVETCHILFISESEAGRMAEVLRALQHRPILTVGDSENFARRGGMVRFVTEKNKIRLRINTEATQRAQLAISSKLLRAAELVRTEKEQ